MEREDQCSTNTFTEQSYVITLNHYCSLKLFLVYVPVLVVCVLSMFVSMLHRVDFEDYTYIF